MALKKELQELVDELEFDTPEDKADFEKHLAKEKLGAAIEARVMKNKDYTTKTQAVAQARKQLEDEQKRWNDEQDSYLQTMTSYKNDMEERLNKALAQVSSQKLYGAALETKVAQLAAQYGEDPEELLADVKQMRESKDTGSKKEPVHDDEEFKKRYVPREEFQTAAESMFGFAPMLRDLDREYHRLYGKEYDGSMQELVKQGIIDVNARRARGQQIDLYGYMRGKLDFDAQRARNAEKQKVDDEAGRKKWEEDKAKEIETRLRSGILAANPTAMRQAPQEDQWRQNLTAEARKEKAQEAPKRTVQETHKRQNSFHQAFLDRQAQREGAGTQPLS